MPEECPANPITSHRREAQSMMPTLKQKKSRYQAGITGLRRPRNRPAVTYVGLGLVAWHIQEGNLKEAEVLLKSFT